MKGGDMYETVIEDIDDVEGDIMEAIEPSHIDIVDEEEEQELEVSDDEIVAVENEKLSFTLTDLEKGNEELLYKKIKKLSEIVLRKHFYLNMNMKDDLISVGVLKAYDALSKDYFDPNKGILNYLYTGMRNEMHNTVYHHNKERYDDEVLQYVKDDRGKDYAPDVRYEKVIDYCSSYDRHEFMDVAVAIKLKGMGFNLIGFNIDDVDYEDFSYLIESPYYDSLVESVVGLFIWDVISKDLIEEDC